MKYIIKKFWCIMIRWTESVERSQMARAKQQMKRGMWAE